MAEATTKSANKKIFEPTNEAAIDPTNPKNATAITTQVTQTLPQLLPSPKEEISLTKRHCAACLKLLEGSQQNPVKVCGGCLKRAYCSKECQQADWSITGTLQRHVNWCTKYECGEEDVDWEVVPVPGKGLGVRAKKTIPAGYRIIVDPVYTDPHDHPGIMDLAPDDAPLDVKFELNSLDGDPSRDGGKSYVGLRVSRVNHDCRPNAGYVYDEVARVEVIFAHRDIQPGEEVCICYLSFARLDPDRPTAGPSSEEEFQVIQRALLTFWGIVCPVECFCKDSSARELVSEGRRINNEIDFLARRGLTEGALLFGDKLLEIQQRLNVSWLSIAGTASHCFRIALRTRKTLGKARGKAPGYSKAVHDIYATICPYSEHTSKYERLLKRELYEHGATLYRA